MVNFEYEKISEFIYKFNDWLSQCYKIIQILSIIRVFFMENLIVLIFVFIEWCNRPRFTESYRLSISTARTKHHWLLLQDRIDYRANKGRRMVASSRTTTPLTSTKAVVEAARKIITTFVIIYERNRTRLAGVFGTSFHSSFDWWWWLLTKNYGQFSFEHVNDWKVRTSVTFLLIKKGWK